MAEIDKENEPNEVGRPLLYKTPVELDKRIEEYFASCFEDKWFDEEVRDKKGKRKLVKGLVLKVPVKRRVLIKPMSVTGLAIFLNTSRGTLVNYKERPEFFDSIKRALIICENYVEDGMLTGDVPSVPAIFNLKNNYGWRDRTETDFTSKGEKIGGFNYLVPNENNNPDNQTPPEAAPSVAEAPGSGN